MTNKEIEQKGKQILKQAEEKGLTDNFLFSTTFDRYLYQLKMLNQLQEECSKAETLVTKEYVKGRPTAVLNPTIRGLNPVSSEANKTLNTLLKVIDSFGKAESKKEEEKDILLDIINGNNCDNDED